MSEEKKSSKQECKKLSLEELRQASGGDFENAKCPQCGGEHFYWCYTYWPDPSVVDYCTDCGYRRVTRI